MTRALEACMSLPVGSIESYRQAVESLPMLSREEELTLARQFRTENDLDAAWRLVTAHLRFVIKIARGYNGYGLPQTDLVQEGNMGLMKAVKRYDPEMGVRLVSFAVHWIRAEMHEYILRNWRIVKVATTKAQRKLFFNLRSSKKRLGWMNSEEIDEVARDLGVNASEVLEMEKRLNAQDAAFDPLIETDDDIVSPSAFLADMRFDPATQTEQKNWDDYNAQKLNTALAGLDKRSQDILHSRWLVEEKSTLHELARKYSVSAERIRQLEKNAIKKLRKTMCHA